MSPSVDSVDTLGVAPVERTLEEILGMPTNYNKSSLYKEPISADQLQLDKMRLEDEKEAFYNLPDDESKAAVNQQKRSEFINKIQSQYEEISRSYAMIHRNYIHLESGKYGLIQCIIDQRVDLVKKLILSQPIHFRYEYINYQDYYGNSALFYCLDENGNKSADCLQLLLDYGAEPSLANIRRNTPLHICAAYNYRRTIKVLIEHGATIQFENAEHEPPHQMARDSDKVASMQNYINTCYDQHLLNLQEKRYHKWTPQMRGLYKSYFDLCDRAGNGAIPLDRVKAAVLQVTGDLNPKSGKLEYKSILPDDSYFQTWFHKANTTNSGAIDFAEFLNLIQLYLTEKAKIEKKLKKKQLLAEKRTKSREAKARSQMTSPSTGQ
jgi:hypothetical protein